MSKVLEKTGSTVISSDLYDRGYDETGHDFLDTPRIAENIVTNPPFHSAEGFVASAVRKADKKSALFWKVPIARERYSKSTLQAVCGYLAKESRFT